VSLIMPLDPSFRSRLRDALHQSVVGRPRPEAAPLEQGPRDEPEDNKQDRADAEQAAWIADGLGGWWRRDAGGVCLVVDREYPADRVHGEREIGHYADALARYQHGLRRFDARVAPADSHTLFSELQGPDKFAPSDLRRPSSSTSASQGLSDLPTSDPRTSDLGVRSLEFGVRTSDDTVRLLFFDLETTGLSGGAGTYAFLVGCGWFEGDRFRTRQYFLSGYGHEAALLRIAAERVPGTTLLSFNGKTFDIPLIEGRYLFHRVPSPFEGVPHIDLLHPARRLWRHRPSDDEPVGRDRVDPFGRYFGMPRSAAGAELAPPWTRRGRLDLSARAASCALGALEEAVLGFRRTGDVPSAEIPARYFHYVRTGDVRPLQAVLEHNRLDLLSLAALASVVARMLGQGSQAARNAHECLALGRLYEHSGAADRATACYERAVEGDDEPAWWGDPIVQQEALRRLAVRHRRERRYDEAAAAWQRLLDFPAAHAAVDFEALHALAVHHEHRSKDLETARALVVRALGGTSDSRLQEALRHRLARIERKLGLTDA